MIDLQRICSLPLLFDSRDDKIIFDNGLSCRGVRKTKLDHLRSILLNKSLRYPENIYSEYVEIISKDMRSDLEKSGTHYNITVLPMGLLGIEYNKTHLYEFPKRKAKLAAIIEILYGVGTIVLQRSSKGNSELSSEITEGILIKAQKGEKVPIPSGYAYTIINTRNMPLILGKLQKREHRADYRAYSQSHGAAIYVIRKNARQEIVKNPKYKFGQRIKRIKPVQLRNKYRLTSMKPLCDQLRGNFQRFRDMLY